MDGSMHYIRRVAIAPVVSLRTATREDDEGARR